MDRTLPSTGHIGEHSQFTLLPRARCDNPATASPLGRPMCCHACAEYSTDGAYVLLIHQAFAAASASLMELMMQRKGLPDMLQAFKSYFLLARGDLFTTFLELAEAELERNAADVTVTRLQSLLELGRLIAGCDCLLSHRRSLRRCTIIWD